MPFLLGLTGNIACGKSTVGQLLHDRYTADYLDADRVVHELYAPGTPETHAIANRFGPDFLQADGTIDRRRLGDLVMGDPQARRELEDILQPRVRSSIEERIASSMAQVVVLDAIRLIEARLYQRCDTVWVVTCARDEQQRRLVASRGMTSEQAIVRIDGQAPQEEKVKFANAVIENRGGLDELAKQVDAAWERTVAHRLTP